MVYANGNQEQGTGGEEIRAVASLPPSAAGQSAESESQMAAALRELRREVAEMKRETAEPVCESESQRVFALLRKLKNGPRERKAPLHTVFHYLVLKGLSGRETARRCRCAPSLITGRIRAIEGRFGMRIDQLRGYASVMVEMQAAVKGERRRGRRQGWRESTDSTGDGEETGGADSREEGDNEP